MNEFNFSGFVCLGSDKKLELIQEEELNQPVFAPSLSNSLCSCWGQQQSPKFSHTVTNHSGCPLSTLCQDSTATREHTLSLTATWNKKTLLLPLNLFGQTCQLPALHLPSLQASDLRSAAADGSDLVAERRHRHQQFVVLVEDTAAGGLIQTQQALAAQHVQGEAYGEDKKNAKLKRQFISSVHSIKK